MYKHTHTYIRENLERCAAANDDRSIEIYLCCLVVATKLCCACEKVSITWCE